MRTALKMARLLGISFSMSLRRSLAFRVNLLFDTIMAVVALLTTLATVLIIFSRTDALAGWTKPEMLTLIGTFELVSGIKATFVDPNLSAFPTRGIREGRLDNHLLQPAPSLFLASLGVAAPLAGIQILLGLGVVALGVSTHARSPALLTWAVWLLLIAIGTAIMWAVSTLLASLAFWAPKLDLQSIYGTAWQLGRYPADIYAKPLQFLLTYVLPLALVTTLPASALLRPPDPQAVFAAVITSGIAVLLATGAWQRGLKQYTGATS